MPNLICIWQTNNRGYNRGHCVHSILHWTMTSHWTMENWLKGNKNKIVKSSKELTSLTIRINNPWDKCDNYAKYSFLLYFNILHALQCTVCNKPMQASLHAAHGIYNKNKWSVKNQNFDCMHVVHYNETTMALTGHIINSCCDINKQHKRI